MYYYYYDYYHYYYMYIIIIILFFFLDNSTGQIVLLIDRFVSLHPSQQFFSYVGIGLSKLNQY